jgi:two-component system NtrC family sensor kinase
MTDAFYKLPTVLILGALVLVLAFLRKKDKSATFRLWLVAWILIFVRFALQVLYTAWSLSDPVYLAVDMAILQVSGVLFLTSVSSVVNIPKRRARLLSGLAVPIAVYAVLAAYQSDQSWAYVVCLTVVAITGILHGLLSLPAQWNALLTSVVLILWGICLNQALHGRVDVGYFALITMTYGITVFLFFRTYRRVTPGIIATSIGFLLWALVAPVTYWLWQLPMGLPIIAADNQSSSFILALGLANVPKFIVAIGMIVTLLENERIVAEASREREHLLNVQMRRFADVTSHLLSGVDVPSFCAEVANLITQATHFQRVAILLTDAQHHMYVAGHSGIKPEDVLHVEQGISKATLETFQSLCLPENRVGANSYRTRTEKMEHVGAVLTERRFDEDSLWRAGDEILVPLRSPRGTYLGMISLDDPKDVHRITAEDLSGIEILAGDIAGAIENAALRVHLFQSEKLAGMGQLVAGVAHELNNPLTAVLGYTEMVTDRISDPTAQRELDVIRREALRMKKIIENLQRFSRQQNLERGAVKLASVVEDVIKVKSYDLLAKRIDVVKKIDPALPEIIANEAHLNQVFLNVLTNAIEAVQTAEIKTILIEAWAEGEQVRLQVTDSGPGFKDENRVFDPFYTTKGPGQGTGLGLSICYAIIRDHGGDITATNIHPNGASILIELPLMSSTTASTGTAAGVGVR